MKGDDAIRERAELLTELGDLKRRAAELEQRLGLKSTPVPPTNATDLEQTASRLLAHYATDFLSVHAANGDYLFASPNCLLLFGWKPEELVGRNAYEFFHPDDLARIAADHARQTGAASGLVRYRLLCADGSYRLVQTRSRSHKGDHGVEHIVCFTGDVQEEVLAAARAETAEQSLVEAHFRGIFSRLSEVLSHEINNPLTILEMQLMLFERAGLRVEDARFAVQRVKSVVAELTLASSEEAESAEEDLAVALERLRALFGAGGGRMDVEVEEGRVALPRSRLYALLHAVLVAHLEGCKESDTVTVRSRRSGHAVQVSISGGGEIVRRVRADLFGVLLDDRSILDGDLPVRIAQRVAREAGVSCTIELLDGLLRTELELSIAGDEAFHPST